MLHLHHCQTAVYINFANDNLTQFLNHQFITKMESTLRSLTVKRSMPLKFGGGQCFSSNENTYLQKWKAPSDRWQRRGRIRSQGTQRGNKSQELSSFNRQISFTEFCVLESGPKRLCSRTWLPPYLCASSQCSPVHTRNLRSKWTHAG